MRGAPMDSIHPSSFVRKAAEMGLEPLDMLRTRYRYLTGRVAEFKALYLQHNEIDPYFWWWIDAAKDRRILVDYANRYKIRPEGTSNGIPRNLITKKEYRGINLLLLGYQE